MDGPGCSLVKPSKESARNCARQFLSKIMFRSFKPGSEQTERRGYTPDEIEAAIYDYYPNRDSYLAKIAKVGLHLSLHTKTGRISWSFQDAIFNRVLDSVGRSVGDVVSEGRTDDYLAWLLTRATNEEVFPELYASGDAITQKERDRLVAHMHLEHSALLNGLQEIVRKCCDSKVCTAEEFNSTYDEMVFKSGTVFETAARSICMVRKVMDWAPPAEEIIIPDSKPTIRTLSPLETTIPAEPLDLKPIDYDSLNDDEYQKVLAQQTLTRQKSVLSKVDLTRNFDVSGQMTCLNVDNLIHNLAVLPEGRYLQLPWEGELLTSEIQADLLKRFGVEVALRRFYLRRLKEQQ